MFILVHRESKLSQKFKRNSFEFVSHKRFHFCMIFCGTTRRKNFDFKCAFLRSQKVNLSVVKPLFERGNFQLFRTIAKSSGQHLFKIETHKSHQKMGKNYFRPILCSFIHSQSGFFGHFLSISYFFVSAFFVNSRF